jgi:hypothetical protein
MAYSTIDKPNQYFNPKLFTGTGSTQSITGVGFQPDLTWFKSRTLAESHNLVDSVRGLFRLRSNSTSAQVSTPVTLDSDGFTVGSESENNGGSMVAWNWKAGGTAVSNTDGSITSSVSANPTAGFSIVTFTGTGANATVGHGLGVKPDIIIIKTTNNAEIWRVYSSVLGATQGGSLDESVSFSGTGSFNSTEPTSNVFTVSGQNAVGASSYNYVAYCFADVKGFSKFGSYVGNGANDGTFVYTGFKPAFVMMKNASQGGKWLMMDNKRPTSGGNPNNARLFANVSNVESTSSNMIDMLSNGFKLLTGDTDHNASGDTNIYMAFAEAPLVGSNNVPANAR